MTHVSAPPDVKLQLSQIEAIPPGYVRAFALVGMYINYFAYMEAKVDELLAALLRTDGLQQAILSFNLDLGSKIYVARCCCALVLSPDEKAPVSKLCSSLNKHSIFRNNIAHSPFTPSDDGGVKIMPVSARSVLKFEGEDISIEQMGAKVTDLLVTVHHLEDLKRVIIQRQPVLDAANTWFEDKDNKERSLSELIGDLGLSGVTAFRNPLAAFLGLNESEP